MIIYEWFNVQISSDGDNLQWRKANRELEDVKRQKENFAYKRELLVIYIYDVMILVRILNNGNVCHYIILGKFKAEEFSE